MRYRRVVIAALAAAAIVLGALLWWSTDSASVKQVPPAAEHQSSLPVQPVQSGPADSGTSSGPGSADQASRPPQRDLMEAIRLAQEAAAKLPPTEGAGPAARQGMSSEEAAKVFEAAVRAHEKTRQISPASPFGRPAQ